MNDWCRWLVVLPHIRPHLPSEQMPCRKSSQSSIIVVPRRLVRCPCRRGRGEFLIHVHNKSHPVAFSLRQFG